MNCRRAEELFSDYRERSLTPPLEREVATHLDSCDACAELYRAFAEVTDALRGLEVPAPPKALTETLVARAREPKPAPRATAVPPRLVAAGSWLAVAAMLTMVMIFRPPELATDLSRTTTRTARDVYSFAVKTYHHTERWIEDLNVLRMTVGVAFEDRIDQINEQLRDLEDAGRRSDESDEQSRDRRDSDQSSRSFS